MVDVLSSPPFFFHWYTGEGPPFAVVAVNVTVVPAQTGLAGLDVILIVGVTEGFTVIVMALLVTTDGVAQLALLVSTQVTTSLLEGTYV